MPDARVAATAIALPALSRRSLLSGLAATSAGPIPSATLPAPVVVTPADPDPELSALMRAFEEARTAYESAQRYYNDCEGRYFDLKPDPPEALTIRGPLGHLLATKWDMWRACELRHLLKDEERNDLWDEARAALPLARRYEARLRRLKRATDVAAAEAAHHAALDRVADVTAAMLKVTARSLSGLAIKARIVKEWGKPDWWDGDGDTYEQLAAQIVDAIIAAADR
jgi:hypothetical protein